MRSKTKRNKIAILLIIFNTSAYAGTGYENALDGIVKLLDNLFTFSEVPKKDKKETKPAPPACKEQDKNCPSPVNQSKN